MYDWTTCSVLTCHLLETQLFYCVTFVVFIIVTTIFFLFFHFTLITLFLLYGLNINSPFVSWCCHVPRFCPALNQVNYSSTSQDMILSNCLKLLCCYFICMYYYISLCHFKIHDIDIELPGSFSLYSLSCFHFSCQILDPKCSDSQCHISKIYFVSVSNFIINQQCEM